MRILINDFGGYAFPAQLSLALSENGHEILHTYCASLQTTPAGCSHQISAADNLRYEPVQLQQPLQKYSFVKRLLQEREYGRKATALLEQFRPDCIVSANTPLDAQKMLWKKATQMRVSKVFWLQDALGMAAKKILSKKLSLPGQLIGSYYERLERRLLKESQRIVLISDAFRTLLRDWFIDCERATVIENWAPLNELTELPRQNAWSEKHNLNGKIVFLYSGTLSLKHDPSLIFEAAKRLQSENALFVVRSQGQGATWLMDKLKVDPLSNLRVEPFGDYSELPLVLASADVLVAILEPDAAVFSVPSKVLTYMCAKRALLLAIPPENHAAAVVAREQAGLICSPRDVEAFVANASRFIHDPSLRLRCGENARSYATRAFNIDSIAARFDGIIRSACEGGLRSPQGSRL